jgi:hypothetical protein
MNTLKIWRKAALFSTVVLLTLGTADLRADNPTADATTTTHKHVAAKNQVTSTKSTDRKAASTTAIPTRDGKGASYVDGNITGGANGKEHAVLTGSQLPRTYHRGGYTTDSSDSTFVYDKNDIRLRSTNTVQDSLRSVPGVNVLGSR